MAATSGEVSEDGDSEEIEESDEVELRRRMDEKRECGVVIRAKKCFSR